MSTFADFKHNISYPGFYLATIALLATALLLAVYVKVSPVIALRAQEDQWQGLSQVLPKSLIENDILETKRTEIFQGKNYLLFTAKDRDGATTAYAIQSETDGFSGAIVLLVGVKPNGDILGVRVLTHSETPGLGDKIETARSDWIYSFNGQSLAGLTQNQWQVKKDGGRFDQFTGATITPRAVVAGVHETLLFAESLNGSKNDE